jgi:hypothetical protein
MFTFQKRKIGVRLFQLCFSLFQFILQERRRPTDVEGTCKLVLINKPLRAL